MRTNLILLVSTLASLPLLAYLSLPAMAGADRSAIIPEIQMSILTGGDDLRGGSVAYAEIRLRNGIVLPKVNLNNGNGWGGNSTNSVSLPLAAGTKLGDLNGASVTISHDGAARNFPDGYDNWNVDQISVATPRICSKNVEIAKVTGRPWIRFTGGKTFQNIPFRIPATVNSASSDSLALNILTGGDDLRGGSVAYAEISLRNGTVLPRINLNNGNGWGGNSTNSVSLPLPGGTKLSDLKSLTLSHDGAPRNFPDGYDNWNVDTVSVNTPEVCNKGISLATKSGRPWSRFTGGQTFKTFTLQVR